MIEKFLNLSLNNIIDKWTWNNTQNFFEADLDMIKNFDDSVLVEFLKNIGLISGSVVCQDCRIVLTNMYYNEKRHPFFRCNKRICSRKRISAVKNSIFEESKLSFAIILKILYYFSCRRSIGDAAECLNISKKTIIDFYKFFRAAIFDFVSDHSMPLGGNGVVVHFDETPITHRHGILGRHQRSNTVWVVGAVDIYTKKCFLKFLPSRSRNDIFSFLTQWILPGSIIHTDCHKSYATLSSLGFRHFTVNHSKNLVEPNGIHTNWIEGIFGCVKKLIRKYDAGFTTVQNLELYLAEFCFRYCFDAFDRRTAFVKIVYVLKKTKEKLDNTG